MLPDVASGGVSILAVGDLFQLPPVGQAQYLVQLVTVMPNYIILAYCGWMDFR